MAFYCKEYTCPLSRLHKCTFLLESMMECRLCRCFWIIVSKPFFFWHSRISYCLPFVFLPSVFVSPFNPLYPPSLSPSICFLLTPILSFVWKPGWASHWSVARFLFCCVTSFRGEKGSLLRNSLPPLAHRGWLRTHLKSWHVNHYRLYHLHIHLSIKRKWRLHPLRSQLNRSNSHCWMRSRFQCQALCRQATAHCCDIKAVIVTCLVKFYCTPPPIQRSVRPIADTVCSVQWINGCIELQAASVGVSVFKKVLLSSSSGLHVKVICSSRCVCVSKTDPLSRSLTVMLVN